MNTPLSRLLHLISKCCLQWRQGQAWMRGRKLFILVNEILLI